MFAMDKLLRRVQEELERPREERVMTELCRGPEIESLFRGGWGVLGTLASHPSPQSARLATARKAPGASVLLHALYILYSEAWKRRHGDVVQPMPKKV
jgi:hypothetical protein